MIMSQCCSNMGSLLCGRRRKSTEKAFCSNREFMGDVLQETSPGLFCANIPRIYISTATLLRDCSIDVYKVAQSAVVLALVHQQCGELRYLHVSHNAILNYDYLHSRNACCLSRVDERKSTIQKVQKLFVIIIMKNVREHEECGIQQRLQGKIVHSFYSPVTSNMPCT